MIRARILTSLCIPAQIPFCREILQAALKSLAEDKKKAEDLGPDNTRLIC